MRRLTLLIGLCLFSSLVSQVSASAKDEKYIIVSLVPEEDPYFEAARELLRLRGGRIIKTSPGALPSLLNDFRQARPQFVAVVLRPEMLDENLVHQFLKLATKVDDDPFVDFAYGFITGDSAEAAVSLAGAGKRAEQKPKQPDMAMVAVAGGELAESVTTTQDLPLRNGYLKQTTHLIAAGESASASASQEIDPKQDDTFIREVMPQLSGHSILLFAGHGYPSHVVGGPTYRHLAGQRFDGAVVMNIACYTGVTCRWFDNDWQSMKIRRKEVPAQESFCLNMLKTGVAGYVAYVSPRPAGPAMFGDALTLATAGESVGELVRNNANSVVLAHLQQGYDGLHFVELADGAPIARKRKVQDMLIAMSTGGVLFGDPAYVPFKARSKAHPVQLTVDRKTDSILARIDVAGPMYHFFCSDQVVMWDETRPSIRLEAVVPLGGRYVEDVRLASSTLGDVPHRLTAATEEHNGQRFLHVKASFAQPEIKQLMQFAQDGLAGSFEIKTSSQPRDAAVVRRAETP